MVEANILIAHSMELCREGLAKILADRGFFIVGTCSTGQQTVEQARQTMPDVIILDSEISECGYIEVIERIKEISAKTRAIILSESQEGRELPLV